MNTSSYILNKSFKQSKSSMGASEYLNYDSINLGSKFEKSRKMTPHDHFNTITDQNPNQLYKNKLKW